MGDTAAAEHPAHTAPAQRPHPHSAPVYVRFDLRQKPFELHSKAPLHLLSVQIAGLADGAEYQTCCLMSRPRDAGAPAVGQKRSRPEEEPEVKTPKTVKRSANRQSDVLRCIVGQPVTERAILEQCGDNRYTREILRRLMALGSVERIGRGGANDPYRYRFLCTPEEAIEQGREDPAVNIRMQRIETKIFALLGEREGFVTEKDIRSVVGDNTGTGKALRNLVKTSRVLRIGRGGVGDPFTYKAGREQGEQSLAAQPSSPSVQSDSHELSDCSTIASSKSPDAADGHSDEENEVAHTLALLKHASPESSPGAQERKAAASICEMYIAAAAALDAVA